MKHKYHLKGIGGKPSKQMKGIQKSPLPIQFFGKSIVEMMNDANKLLDKEITRITDNKCKLWDEGS